MLFADAKIDTSVHGPFNIMLRIRDIETDEFEASLLAFAPVAQAYKSPFNGSMCFSVNLDEKHTWAHGLYENGRHFVGSLGLDGKLRLDQTVCGHTKNGWKVHKLRACKVKSVADAIAKLHKYALEAAEVVTRG